MALLASGTVVAKQSDRQQPINVTSTSFDGTQQQPNGKTPGHVIWTGKVVLTQGTLTVTGNKATGYLDGDNQLTRVVVDGNATMKQQDEQNLWMRGNADNIDYTPDNGDAKNSSSGVAVLTGHAHVEKEVDPADRKKLNQSNGDKLTYNTTSSTMTGESNGSAPVHMIFQPKQQPAAAPGAAPAKPATPPAAPAPQTKKP
ncbi:lipopolysaccharide transport periplasmic protein LptA [Luteibacter sp.]|uniref:lipopolysaccharide transport periplasmic protein LptA n=1 Tax=Luteibacter sp. TaxID=1886636 RepID=UPI0025C4BC3A|nr:lipopolysaccharide transport periplasmic protein LptA [Luteibacter sp.]